MCNLMGVYIPEGEKLTQELKTLLFSAQVFASTKHGDGFGYFAVSPAKEFTRKTHLSAELSTYTGELLDLPEDTQWVITHTRRVSSGLLKLPGKDAPEKEWTEYFNTKQKFAHPFVKENVVVAHNGTFIPKEGVVFEMDSLYMAESLSKKLEALPLKKALDKTFDDFKGGLMSLLIAVKKEGVFRPYIIKGNKPLYRFVCVNTGVTIFITDDAFIIPFLIVFNKQNPEYNFIPKGSLKKRGIWEPFSEQPLYEKDYISYAAKNAREEYPKVTTKTRAKRIHVVPASKTKFDKFCEVGGLKKLVKVTTWILTSLTYDQVRNLLDLSEAEAVTILEHVEKKEYPQVRTLLS